MSFARDVERITARMKAKGNEVVQETTKELFTATVFDTPVDTGRLRGNWQCTINIPASGELDRFGGEGPKSEIYGTVTAPGLFYLTNNLPYAERIEYDGWSQQAPQGMVRINARRVHHVLRKHAR